MVMARQSGLMATPKLDYSPHKPFPRQQAFLDLDTTEAFYGGGAGPGKTDALLMAALQYVHVPNYSALILRRDFPRLSLPGSIMDRARAWLHNTAAVWNEQKKFFRFPSGAVLQFGYIDNPADRLRYQSAEFQFIGWDELTEFNLGHTEHNPYLFMFSRLRRTQDIPVPLRMRSASNPGQIGHQWVRQRFITDEALRGLMEGRAETYYADFDRAFVPALLDDNPAVNRAEYIKNLMHLPPITRERLLRGDWSIQENSLIKAEWLRYYRMQGEIIQVLDVEGNQRGAFDCRRARRFATVDTAGTSRQIAEEKRKDKASWSVCQVWDEVHVNGRPWLFLRHMWRDRVGFTDLCNNLRRISSEWGWGGRLRMKVENAHFGPAVADACRDLDMELITTAPRVKKGESGVPGKVERASELFVKLERGEVYLPQHNTTWLPILEAEWLAWTGDEDEPADTIDAAAHAAIDSSRGRSGTWGGVVRTGATATQGVRF